MSDTQTINLPETLTFTDADRKATQQGFAVVREGQMPMEVVSATRRKAPWDAYQIEMVLSPVSEDGEVVKKFKAKKSVNMPVANGKYTPENLDLFGCYILASTIDPKFPQYPRKQQDGTYTTQDGTSITKDEANALRAEVDEAVRNAAAEWWANNGAPLIGVRGYGVVTHTTGGDGNIYPKVKRFGSQPDQEKSIITTDFAHPA